MAEESETHKAAGNDFFKSGEYLKAAASYTKAIKLQPENHVYYSNRSQSFLKLNKVTKALDDADKCISLAPDFVKGYHRKATALHAMGEPAKTDEAVEVLLSALRSGVEEKELVRLGVQIKGRSFVQLVDAQRKAANPPTEPPAASEQASVASQATDLAAKPTGSPAAPGEPPFLPFPDFASVPAASLKSKASPAAETPPPKGQEADAAQKPIWELDPEGFAVNSIQWILRDFVSDGTVPTVCYLQPCKPKRGAEAPPVGHVNIGPAFSSPETLLNCAEFLRQQAAGCSAQAAVVVVRKSTMAYPCVWKGKSKSEWPVGDKDDGVFMQLESPKMRMMFFTVLKEKKSSSRAVGDTIPLDIEQFAIFPRLFE
eukprot:CAMPEP_0119358834 /NCGR_PEP_ID=MMETSP1334-20130426/6910_1 /TAXON_ID=127549 /ORGANISM="Calcidiscus leptoporus, Strain RCC1130" /LENGTH=370 /DNA_ID=CAMNT_0007373393 /DNA_START=54 /DNA_END=1166 /DNA_ORIENTATION=-